MLRQNTAPSLVGNRQIRRLPVSRGWISTVTLAADLAREDSEKMRHAEFPVGIAITKQTAGRSRGVPGRFHGRTLDNLLKDAAFSARLNFEERFKNNALESKTRKPARHAENDVGLMRHRMRPTSLLQAAVARLRHAVTLRYSSSSGEPDGSVARIVSSAASIKRFSILR